MKELDRDLTSRELSEWMAYDRISPFGDKRDDFRAGIIASTTANCHRPKEIKEFTPQDFMCFDGNDEEMDESKAIESLLYSVAKVETK